MKNDLEEVFKEFFDLIEDVKKWVERRRISLIANKAIKSIKELCQQIDNKRFYKK